jgi:hypothetical protein
MFLLDFVIFCVIYDKEEKFNATGLKRLFVPPLIITLAALLQYIYACDEKMHFSFFSYNIFLVHKKVF